jgi:hypothetical protein
LGQPSSGAAAPNVCVTIVPFPTPPSQLPEVRCSFSITKNHSRGFDPNPETGGAYTEVTMTGRVECNTTANPAGRGVELIDRTPGTGCDGQLFPDINGCNLGGQPQPIIGNQQASSAVSSGTVRLYDAEYHPRAQQAEVIFSVGLIVPTNGFRFRSCGDLSGVRILRCSPNPADNTNGVVSYSITVGSGVFNTGVEPPCRTDTDPIVLKGDALVVDWNAEVIITPHIKWCWSGPRITSITKTQNATDVIHNNVPLILSITAQKDGDDPTPFVDNPGGLPQAGRYHVRYKINFESVDGSKKFNCIVQMDRNYKPGNSLGNPEKLDSKTCR